jgi:LPXTG-motif cell wall-anchored protein
MKVTFEWNRTVMILAVGAIGLAFSVKSSAQVQTSTQEKAGQSSKEVKVDHAEVIAVQGNDLIVKMEDGTLRHLANVPESTRITADGQQVGVHQLKPGMHLQRTVTTTTTPKVIVTTQTVTGKVWHVNAPSTVILTMENGENQSFKVPAGQKFTVDGKETDVFSLRKGMRVSATKVVEEPLTQVEHEASISGHMPPPPPAPPADAPIIIAIAAPTPPPPTEAAAAPAELPKTGSELPVTALLGLMLITSSTFVRLFRTARENRYF